MNQEEKILNIMTRLLNIADSYLTSYCENFDEYILSNEDIEEIEDEEEKERAIELKATDDFLNDARDFIEEYKKTVTNKRNGRGSRNLIKRKEKYVNYKRKFRKIKK